MPSPNPGHWRQRPVRGGRDLGPHRLGSGLHRCLRAKPETLVLHWNGTSAGKCMSPHLTNIACDARHRVADDVIHENAGCLTGNAPKKAMRKAVIIHTRTKGSTGCRVEICLFGSI